MVAGGWMKRMRSSCLKGRKFQFVQMRKFCRWTVVAAAQQCGYTQCHQAARLDMVQVVDVVLHTFYHNKKIRQRFKAKKKKFKLRTVNRVLKNVCKIY